MVSSLLFLLLTYKWSSELLTYFRNESVVIAQLREANERASEELFSFERGALLGGRRIPYVAEQFLECVNDAAVALWGTGFDWYDKWPRGPIRALRVARHNGRQVVGPQLAALLTRLRYLQIFSATCDQGVLATLGKVRTLQAINVDLISPLNEADVAALNGLRALYELTIFFCDPTAGRNSRIHGLANHPSLQSINLLGHVPTIPNGTLESLLDSPYLQECVIENQPFGPETSRTIRRHPYMIMLGVVHVHDAGANSETLFPVLHKVGEAECFVSKGWFPTLRGLSMPHVASAAQGSLTTLRNDCLRAFLGPLLYRPRRVNRPELRLKHAFLVSRVVFTPDGQSVVTASRDGVRIWSLNTAQVERHFSQVTGWTQCDVSADGRYLAMTGEDRRLVVWDFLSERQIVVRTDELSDEISCLRFSPSGHQLALGAYDGSVYLYDLSAAKFIKRATAHGDVVRVVLFLNDRMLLSASQFANAIIWDYGAEDAKLRVIEQSLEQVIYAGDRVGNAQEIVVANTLGPHGVYIWRPLTSNDSDRFIILSREWPSWKHHQLERAFRNDIFAVRSAPGGEMVAVAGSDGNIHIIDIRSCHETIRFTGHTGLVLTLDISRDGRWLASGSKDGTVNIWRLVR
ncbi:MAG: hypothetical protein KatS3mg110_4419 [Pirellulaceae bacterium]|nr:MAG: hypothetical protein KatS3mg110_4419 [Pirellulaceae bacterium]